MYKTKKGFTLIEIIVTLTVLSIVIACFPITIKTITRLQKELLVDNEIDKIHSFIITSKYLSRTDKRIGRIHYDMSKNMLKYNNNKSEKSLILTYTNITEINSENRFIEINKEGIIMNSCTIKIDGINNKIYKLSIGVGVEIIQIKK